MIDVKCSKCNKAFQLKDTYKNFAERYPEKVTCFDCKEGKVPAKAAEPAKPSYTAKAHSTPAAGGKGIEAADLHKAYSELVAEFGNEIEEVRAFLGAWATTICLSRKK